MSEKSSPFDHGEMLVGQARAMVVGARSTPDQLPGVLAMAECIERLADRVEAIDKTLTKPSGALTNEWYWNAQATALRIARRGV